MGYELKENPMNRGKHRDAILDYLSARPSQWTRGTTLVEAVDANPSSIRITALLMVDDGILERRRTHGKSGRGQAVEYRVAPLEKG